MMSKTTLSIAMLLSLLLASLPAAAERRGHDKREPKIEKVAHKLAVATSELYAEARAAGRHQRSWRTRRALWSLSDLERRACAFSERVERYGFTSSELEQYASFVYAMNHRVHDFAFALYKPVEYDTALCFAQSVHDNLLCCLSSDSAERAGLHFHLNNVFLLVRDVDFLCVCQRNLLAVVLYVVNNYLFYKNFK